VQYGPARNIDKSMMRIPSNGARAGPEFSSGIGLAPAVGEPMYEYWARNMPNIMPLSLQRKQGHTRDIELKAETLGNMLSSGAKKTTPVSRK
jgi:hypothetical protein